MLGPMGMLAKLLNLHAEMFGALAELERLERSDCPCRTALARARLRIARADDARARFFEAELFPHVHAIAPDSGAAAISDLKTAAMLLRSEQTIHVSYWSPRRIFGRWPQYCGASRSLRRAQRRLIAFEQALLLPAIAAQEELDAAAEMAA